MILPSRRHAPPKRGGTFIPLHACAGTFFDAPGNGVYCAVRGAARVRDLGVRGGARGREGAWEGVKKGPARVGRGGS